MYLVNVLRNVLVLLLPVSITLTTYLYLYPVFQQCAFTSPSDPHLNSTSSFSNTLWSHYPLSRFDSRHRLAHFRLLALGDPQLEGDTSLPDPNAPFFPHYRSFLDHALNQNGKRNSLLRRIQHSLHDLVDLYFEDVPAFLEGWRKQIDLWGNDYYLAHVYRTMRWWTKPTHVSVLGDLLGSQWIDDREFEKRSGRFWNRVFKGGRRLEDEFMAERATDDMSATAQLLDPSLGLEDAVAWSNRIINIAGNHDIGYAGDLDEHRLSRFERLFGKANYELRLRRPLDVPLPISPDDVKEGQDENDAPEIRIVVLNSMNLDTPVRSQGLQDQTYSFLNRVITNSYAVDKKSKFTVLLTHIPLYKPEGVCVDAPFFDFFSGHPEFNGVREQNHLSGDASRGILEGLFGMNGDASVEGRGVGRNGIIINGHDHEGCDTYHFINQTRGSRDWEVTRTENSQAIGKKEDGLPGIREITLRAMMGEYGGNAGLLSLWHNPDTKEWEYGYENCALGTQHIWWTAHIVDLIAVIIGLIWLTWKFLSDAGIVPKGEFGIKALKRGGTEKR